MRITLLVGERVVLAVYRDPFLGRYPGGQPQDETERERDGRVQSQSAMGGRPMQVNGGAEDGELGDYDGRDHAER